MFLENINMYAAQSKELKMRILQYTDIDYAKRQARFYFLTAYCIL